MGRGMSLKVRLDLLFGLLLFFGLAADVGRMIADARPRIQAESEAMIRISRDFVLAAVDNLKGSPNPEAGLRSLLGGLGGLRHVRIGFSVTDGDLAPAFIPAAPVRDVAPAWFSSIIHSQKSATTIPVVLDDRKMGKIVIASDPSDEIDEVWQDVLTLVAMGGAVALAALIGASLLLGRTLAPMKAYGATLGRLRDGDYHFRAEPAGSPEFIDICSKINSLAETLEGLSGDNQRLIQRLMQVQDDERKAIAHELHDEIGPHLFGIRANAAALAASLRAGGLEKQASSAKAISDQVEALQGHNRRILRRLRPAALDDLGLAEALEILVKSWSEIEPSVDLTLSLPDRLEDCDPQQSLALYRVVQEALTNVFRHANAHHAWVTIAYRDKEKGSKSLEIKVRDDGLGLGANARPGLGLTGMRERMRGLGGSFACGPSPEGGTLVEALFPLRS
jgi:two-component system, NarL family, sensor histidine kinase UhpB